MNTNRQLCCASSQHPSRPVSRRAADRSWAKAMLDVLYRRGRSYGLLTLYEESRLNSGR